MFIYHVILYQPQVRILRDIEPLLIEASASSPQEIFWYKMLSSNATNATCENVQLSLPVRIFHIVVLSAVFFLGIVGNTLIIVAVYKRPELKKTMNYFIVNMAVSDFVFPIAVVPASLADVAATSWQWPVGNSTALILCKIKSFLMSVSFTVSIQSLVWITIDRFVAVVWPLKFHLISPRLRRYAIGTTWVVALSTSAVDLKISKIKELDGRMTCTEERLESLFVEILNYVRVTLFFFSPIILMTALYSAIAVTLRKQEKVNIRRSTVQHTNRKIRQAIKMGLSVVLSFYLFLLPYSVMLMLLPTPESSSCLYKYLDLFFSLALKLSSATNPIICFTFMENYRRGLKDVCSFVKHKQVNGCPVEQGITKEVTLQHFAQISRMEDNFALREK